MSWFMRLSNDKDFRIGLLVPKIIGSPAVVRLYDSIAHFARSIGIEVIGELKSLDPTGRPNILKSFLSRYYLYTRLISAVFKFDAILILYPYPVFNLRTTRFKDFELGIWKAVSRHVKIVAYVYDLPVLQGSLRRTERIKALEREHKFFDLVDVFMVFNEEMAKYLHKQGVENKRIVIYEILDHYGPLPPVLKPLGKPVRIIYAGGLLREYAGFLEHLGSCRNCRYIFFGKDGVWLKKIPREDFEYKGFVPPTLISKYLQEADFGLLAYHPQRAWYMRFGHGDKFTLYISNGLPIIVLSNLEYPVRLVERYKIGYVVKSLEDIPAVIARISDDEYHQIRLNVLQLALKTTQGFFFKKAFLEALKRL